MVCVVVVFQVLQCGQEIINIVVLKTVSKTIQIYELEWFEDTHENIKLHSETSQLKFTLLKNSPRGPPSYHLMFMDHRLRTYTI